MTNFNNVQANFTKFDTTRRGENGKMLAIFQVYAGGALAYTDELNEDMIADEIEALSARFNDAYTDMKKQIEYQLREYDKGLQRLKLFQTDIHIPKDGRVPKTRLA